MSGVARSGAILGFLMGCGLLLIWVGLPRHRRPGLAGRVVPYLRDTPRPSRLLDIERAPKGAVAAVTAPIVKDLGALVERIMGGADSVRRRQLRAGVAADVDRFRAEQVLWGALGAAVGGLLGTTALLVRDAGAVTVVMMTLIGAGVGITGADYNLSRRAQRREARMLMEFPTVAELLALAVAAGEGAVGALDRVCRLSSGELAGELRRCLADARAGANLPTALQGLADRTGLPSLRRFVDGVVIAVQRGTPLAEVLRAQAQDVREEGRRGLMEAGGRKEIAMMVPVIIDLEPFRQSPLGSHGPALVVTLVGRFVTATVSLAISAGNSALTTLRPRVAASHRPLRDTSGAAVSSLQRWAIFGSPHATGCADLPVLLPLPRQRRYCRVSGHSGLLLSGEGAQWLSSRIWVQSRSIQIPKCSMLQGHAM